MNTTSETTTIQMPAEWERIDAVMISWPHSDTDWAYMLDEVDQCYQRLADAITKRAKLLILTPEPERIEKLVENIAEQQLQIIRVDTNDTWIRDYGPIAIASAENEYSLADFRFDGWGLKFASNLDNQVTSRLANDGIFKVAILSQLDFTLEGGSIESDGNGSIMTTSECVLSPNRGHSDKAIVDKRLRQTFGAKKVIFIENGALVGDDTDSHIDTLARFLPGKQIAYVKSDDIDDVQYPGLEAMEKELKAITDIDGNHYSLVTLPCPSPIYDPEDGHRLPATYANFLFVNGVILLPTYNQPDNDAKAIEALQKACPDYEVIPVDCRALIRQHGSLHCATMQIYPNTLA